jgi:hypothetical protein
MRTISRQEWATATQTGMFEGESLDEGIYTPIRVEKISDTRFRLIFQEHGEEFNVEAEFDEHLAQTILNAHREFRLNRILREIGRVTP